ncbi:poly-gamma-glutamate synthesis protein (capsule biosynthesis protein) [Youngiibacter multivorans]|uniref:Poly-gamma-glutamate synthesis protein (Capsule biosynthesis protein) n=2 Tax=Youngiibacter multivorans TaxID=937251 RepID=A0ABS4G1X8_9CLOT|nr:CapA family protein [Youngiibacter multivorans]MBP1918550.1 poly-gamma-glutamate synthesis protein (capsule biosynthesis protein) [Youngiibacter multivorans]
MLLLSSCGFFEPAVGAAKPTSATVPSDPSNPSVPTTPSEAPEPDNTVVITAVGDIMVHYPQLIAQKTGEGTYDFTDNFIFIKDIIKESDLSFANLETTILASKKPSTYPRFNSPPELLDAIKETGFDIISTINNHTMDTGKAGVLATLDELEERNLTAFGTYRSKNDAKYLVRTVKNIKIGMAAFTCGYFNSSGPYINNIPTEGIGNQLNIIDTTSVDSSFEKIRVQIEKMKSDGCEFITLVLHWGTEYQKEPNSYQKKLAQKLIDEGVDLILGSHPHLVQSMEFVESTDGKHEGLVAYSMGNFLSNQRFEILEIKGTETGMVARVTLEKDEKGNVEIRKAEYVPTWISLTGVEEDADYKILPIGDDFKETAEKYEADEKAIKESLEWLKAAMKDEKVMLYGK